MKKAGIMTWHYLDNYGSILQAYAMKKILEKNNLEPVFINYRAGAKTGLVYDLLRKVKYNMPLKNNAEKRKSQFYQFRKKHFKETKMFKNIEELKKYNFKYDLAVCGSDQIWSSKRFDEAYYLSFLDKKIKKSSYAASTIEDKYTKDQKTIIKNCLNEFSNLSVREEIGVEIIKKITQKDVTEVLDPTLLLDKEEWTKLIKTKPNYENYVLCYFLGEEDKYENIVSEIKKEYKCDYVVNINIKEIHNFGDYVIRDAGVEDFLSLIKYAKVVVSDSFHAILFGINLEKEFYAIKRFENEQIDNQNERINNILRKIDGTTRYISAHHSLPKLKPLDYDAINKKLEKYKEISKEYIKKVVSGVK